MAVKVPSEVAEALDFYKEEWNHMSVNDRNLMFLTIPNVTVSDRAAVLKQFSRKQPTQYIQALANGYEPELNVQEELEQMITLWINKPYVKDEKRDIKDFANMVINYFQYKR